MPVLSILRHPKEWSLLLFPAVDKKRGVQLQAAHLAYLEQHPYEEFTPDEIAAAKKEMQKEMEVVKSGMGHGDLSQDAYTQVWEECLAQVSSVVFPLITNNAVFTSEDYFLHRYVVSTILCPSRCSSCQVKTDTRARISLARKTDWSPRRRGSNKTGTTWPRRPRNVLRWKRS